jgi:uncharacterized membrane protein
MPAKKTARKAPSKAESSSDMAMIWKWVFIVGALVSAIAGAIGFSNDVLTWILILAGIVVGVLWRSTDDLMGFGIRYLVLLAVATALGALPGIGGYLTGFFQGFVVFLGPVALATLVMYFLKKYFGVMI